MIKLIFLLLSFTVSAENYVHLGMWSSHPGKSQLNEVHNLVGIEINNVFLHRFKNSLEKPAYYGGYIKRDLLCYGKLCAGTSVGFMHGYPGKKFQRIGFGVISYEKNGIGFDISYLPDLVTAFQFKFTDEAFEYLNINEPWNTKGYVELSLDHFDPDGESSLGYKRNNGATYDAKLYLTDDIFIKGSYTTTDSGSQPDVSEEKFTPVWTTGKPSQIDSRGSIQIGKDYNILSVGLSYNQISIQETYLNRPTGQITSTPQTHYWGYGVHISKGYQLTDNLSIYTEAAIVDDLITDFRLTLETRYKITDNLEITLRTIDFERWNSSQYQLGLRWNL